MANEAILRTETELPVNMTVDNATAIEKGTLLQVSDANAVHVATGSGVAFAGIAASEKSANDGITSIAVYKRGKFDLVQVSGAASITVGQIVSLSGQNLIKTATEAEIAAGGAVGKAMETATGNERIQVML